MPGEQGNAAFFGHSSSNLFNNGKYKYAFVLLHRLEIGDTFMVQKDSKRYVYKVFEKRIVKPTEVSVLDPRDRPVATLVTCDPPGTDLNRLVIVGEQITPDPAANVASTAPAERQVPATLPSEAPTLWGRLWRWLTS
jgi:sortase A